MAKRRPAVWIGTTALVVVAVILAVSTAAAVNAATITYYLPTPKGGTTTKRVYVHVPYVVGAVLIGISTVTTGVLAVQLYRARRWSPIGYVLAGVTLVALAVGALLMAGHTPVF